eukprot:8341779-Pyramimonas_sp.AAC.1
MLKVFATSHENVYKTTRVKNGKSHVIAVCYGGTLKAECSICGTSCCTSWAQVAEAGVRGATGQWRLQCKREDLTVLGPSEDSGGTPSSPGEQDFLEGSLDVTTPQR